MTSQENRETLNRINTLFPEQLAWIKKQLELGSYMKMQGRDILVKAPAPSTGVNIINFPNKGEVGFIGALIKVYNCALDYLEGSLNAACLENQIIRFVNNAWVLNDKPIVWPAFDPRTAEYAKSLDSILKEYYLFKRGYNPKLKNDDKISVKQVSVRLESVDVINIPDIKSTINVKPKVENVSSNQNNFKLISGGSSNVTSPANDNGDLLIQKISDGDVLDSRDINSLRSQNSDMVIITCQNINDSKEEDIFVRNAAKCQAENFNVGAFIYGKANDEHMGAIELKRMLKLFNKFDDNFSKFVIYSIDNNYVKKNKNSDVKLLDFINMYNSIISALKQAGYNVMLSMDLTSGKIIDDINRRFNTTNEHEVVYMAVVRDADMVDKNASSIIVDPGNDYDIVKIKNEEILKQINDNLNEGLARVA